MDPVVEVQPVKGLMDHLLESVAKEQNMASVCLKTLTKRMAEDLTGYFTEVGCGSGISILILKRSNK